MSYWKEPSESLIALKDTSIVQIECDHDYSPGYCDTCDIGESYINEVNLQLLKEMSSLYALSATSTT